MLARWLDERACRFDEEDASQLDEICTWQGSTDQLLHGKLTSTTTGSGTTAPSKRAPEEVLLAVPLAHSSMPKTEITRKRNPDTNSSALLLNMLLQIGS